MPTKEEIKAGIQNAIDRGDSLQKAMQSFVNAGYNIEEVKQAAQDINMGITQHIQPEHVSESKDTEKQPKQNFFKRLFKKKSKTNSENIEKSQKSNPETKEPKEENVEEGKQQHPEMIKKKIPWKIIGLSAALIVLIIALILVWIFALG